MVSLYEPTPPVVIRRRLRLNVNSRDRGIHVHANIRQTMDTYSHVLPNMQQQAAERMDAMLG